MEHRPDAQRHSVLASIANIITEGLDPDRVLLATRFPDFRVVVEVLRKLVHDAAAERVTIEAELRTRSDRIDDGLVCF